MKVELGGADADTKLARYLFMLVPVDIMQTEDDSVSEGEFFESVLKSLPVEHIPSV